jgi:hemolysin activation/secretion protein
MNSVLDDRRLKPKLLSFLVVALGISLSLGFFAGPAVAQLGPTPGPNLPIPFPPKTPSLPEKPAPTLPPPLVPPGLQPLEEREPKQGIRVFVREIRVVGNTVFKPEEIDAITAPYTNRELTTEDFEALRLTLTMLYVNHGYITSGAVMPDQTVTDGVITYEIVEGKLSRIDVEGTYWFRPSYFQKRIALSAGPPLNINNLQERLQLLQTDPRVKRLNAELRPGLELGDSALNVRVADANPFKAFLEFNNYQSPTVGAEQGLATIVDENVTGFGDTLSLQYGRSAGVNPILNFRYAAPINSYDTTVSVQYRRFDFTVKEEPFKALDITNKAEIFSVGVRQPLYRTLANEFAVSVTGDYETNKSTLLGQPFSFVAGANNGEFKVAALRFAQEYVHRTSNQVISALSRFSVGIGVLGATTTASPAEGDARFFSWLGEAQLVQVFTPWRIQFVSRAVAQLANDHLFPLEQVSVGGRYSVRGYREYTLVQDNAAIANMEFRIPVWTTSEGVDRVFIAPFADIGHAWQTTVQTQTPPPQTLASAGVGLLWEIRQGSRFEIYWGQQLNHFKAGSGNLQDHGIHLQLIVEVF